jgi:hypothetical protein
MMARTTNFFLDAQGYPTAHQRGAKVIEYTGIVIEQASGIKATRSEIEQDIQ